MKSMFSKALLLAALTASGAYAKKGKTFEANAFVTPKRDQTHGLHPDMEPYLKQNLLNLRQTEDDLEAVGKEIWHDIHRSIVTGG